jgi:hypothetical protein
VLRLSSENLFWRCRRITRLYDKKTDVTFSGAEMTSVRCKKIWPVPLIVEVVISAALFGCNDSSNTHSDTYYYPIVIKEADALPDFPGASIVEKDAGKKYANAWSRKRLRVKDGYDPVVQFYDEELLNRGWRKFDS